MLQLFTRLALGLLLSGVLTGCLPGLLFGGAAAGVGVLHDRRTSGTILEDQTIEFKASAAFQQYRELASPELAHINVTSYNNAVLLTGEVTTPELRQKVEEIVQGISGVKYVYNELTVARPSSVASRATDTAVTAAVKASLLGITELSEFDPTRVKVVTEQCTVYLFGLLRPEEADAVTGTVRWVSGVQKVVKLFEYI